MERISKWERERERRKNSKEYGRDIVTGYVCDALEKMCPQQSQRVANEKSVAIRAYTGSCTRDSHTATFHAHPQLV